jgi:hypothetical protein
VGRPLAGLEPLPPARERALVKDAEAYGDVEPARGYVPAHLVGRIAPGVAGGGRVIAVAVNGTVAATGRTFTLEGARHEQFSLLIPERYLRPGSNRLELVVAEGGAWRLLGRGGHTPAVNN